MSDHAVLRTLIVLGTLAAGAGGTGCRQAQSPSLSGLRLGMGYDEAVEITGSEGEHLHDRGVRMLHWRYPDDSLIETGIHDGRLSGLNVDVARRGAQALAWRASRQGIRSDMSEWELRAHLAPPAITVEDSSDRECRWTWSDGSLTVLFMRGKLERATWWKTGASEPEVLVEPADRVEVLFAALRSERPSDRYRALLELRELEDWRIADEVVDLLVVEDESSNRAQAGLLLADLRDERASDLLLPDLEEAIISDDILDAIGRIGDHRAVEALIDAEERVGSGHTRAKIRSARAQILSLLEP